VEPLQVGCLVVLLEVRQAAPGEHWLVVFVDRQLWRAPRPELLLDPWKERP
jgi:hypothetical protein